MRGNGEVPHEQEKADEANGFVHIVCSPLAIKSGTAGREVEGPMAIVILGGLITSTALNLLALPILALKYGRFEKKHGNQSM